MNGMALSLSLSLSLFLSLDRALFGCHGSREKEKGEVAISGVRRAFFLDIRGKSIPALNYNIGSPLFSRM